MYSTLRNIIYNKAHLDNFNSSDNSLHIREADKSAKCVRIDLLKFESETQTFAFELDSKNIRYRGIHKISPYFENGKGLDKGNDALIFTKIRDKNYLFICELKDGGKPSDFIPQFKSSKCFVKYLKSILKEFYKINIDNIVIKYLVFSKVSPQITPTSGKYKSSDIKGFDVYHLNCCRKKYYIESFI